MLKKTLSVADLLHSLTVAGLGIELSNGDLKVVGDCRLLTVDQKSALVANKPTLVAMLQPKVQPRAIVEGLEFFEKLALEVGENNSEALTWLVRVPAPRLKPCRRCNGHNTYVAVIHEGESTRRDCAKCGAFIDFPTWLDRKGTAELLEVLKDGDSSCQ